jgi:hypothetical protein
MDPFIESQRWEGFHTSLMVELRNTLMPLVRPRFIVDVERHIFLGVAPEDRPVSIKPDVYISETPGEAGSASEPSAGAVSVSEPVIVTLPHAEHIEQNFLVIQDGESLRVVTVIEVLPPWNKRPGDGRTEYLNKRENVFRSMAHLVEIDLLRGGRRLPTVEPLPSADYFAFVCRVEQRPQAEVYHWSLRDRLPTIPIPLTAGCADVRIDLAAVFSQTYDHAGYDYILNYDRPVRPVLDAADAEWVRSIVPRAT